MSEHAEALARDQARMACSGGLRRQRLAAGRAQAQVRKRWRLRRLETALDRLRLDRAAAAAIAKRDLERRVGSRDRPYNARLDEIGARRIAVERMAIEAVRAIGEDRLGRVERLGREAGGLEFGEAQPANACRRRLARESSVHVIPHIRIGGDEVPEQVCADENLILFFGRIWEYKGLEYLIRAEPTVTSKVPQAKIVIAGRGEDFDRYRRLMVHPENFIVYNEYVSDEKRADLFRRASVVVLPYTEASQSGVIPIAYHFGKPVVATDVGGLPDMVEHGRTGLLVPPRDANALAEALILLLQNKELRRQYAENGRRKMSTECAPEIVARKTRNVYLQALSVAQQPIKDMRQGLTDFL